MTTTCPWVTYVGPYLLDGLEPVDDVAFVAHLDGCAACQSDVRELSGVARQLRELDRSQFVAASPDNASPSWDPPARLRNAVVGSIEGMERVQRRRWRGAILAAAAAAILAVLTVATVVSRDDGDTKTRRYELLAGAGSAGLPVAGYVKVGVVPTGTYVQFHAAGLPKGALYRMWFEKPDGTRVPIGSFTAIGGAKWFVCEATSGLGMDGLAAVGASDSNGKTVLRADFPKSKPV